MAYADYEFYITDFLNGRTEIMDYATFPFYANKASTLIKSATYNRATSTSEIELCCCALAELIYNYDKETNITSEKVGEYSMNYKQTTLEDFKAQQDSIISEYLAHTGLLYCGVR